jgi:hypothetical protein
LNLEFPVGRRKGRREENVQKYISKWIPLNSLQHWEQAAPDLG